MIEITVSKDGELARVLRGDYCITGVTDNDGVFTALVGRADAAEVIGAVCTLASRAAYELGCGDKKAGKKFLKIIEETLKSIRKSPEWWRELQEAKEIQEGAQNDRAQN